MKLLLEQLFLFNVLGYIAKDEEEFGGEFRKCC